MNGERRHDRIGIAGGRPLYDTIGRGYRRFRQPDPRIAAQIARALAGATSVLSVGAGTGSYEPLDRPVLAVEPSGGQIRQRPAGAAPVLRGSAERLPFPDDSFAAVLAVLTIHHWGDLRAGLSELRRVARERVVVLTWDPDGAGFWLTRDYFPDIIDIDRRIMPSIPRLIAELGGRVAVQVVPVPWDCQDGFLGAYWRRPEHYLDPERRSAISTFGRLPDVAPRLERLRHDLVSGAWQQANPGLIDTDTIDPGYRLLVCT